MAASIVSAYDAPAAESALESQDPTPDLAQPRRTEVAPPPPSRWRARFPSLVAGYGLGVVTSGVLVSIAFPVWPQPSAPVAALTPPVATAPPVAQMEGAGFALAALRLQIAIASSRPWRREYDALVAMAPPGAIPQPIASLLGVHAIRGVPNEVELRERFIELAPQLPKRLRRSFLHRSLSAARPITWRQHRPYGRRHGRTRGAVYHDHRKPNPTWQFTRRLE